MWLFLINPLKLCSYGSWSLQGYVCKSSCCQCHIYIYSCLDIEMFKTLSVHFIDWWLCRSHSATQPLCQSGWCSHSATLPEWLEQPLSHSATLPEWLEAATQPLSHSATQPLCQSGWSSHSATQSLCQSDRSSHSATQPLCQSGWSSHSATQPLCQSGWVAEWLSHSATLAEWLSGWCENFRHCAFNLILCDIFGIFRDVMEVRRYKHGNHECLMASSSHFQDKFHTEPSQTVLIWPGIASFC